MLKSQDEPVWAKETLDKRFEDTAARSWTIIPWTQDIEDSLWLVQPYINHATFFFSPTSQTVSALKKTLSYLIALPTLQFCWPVNKKSQNDMFNHSPAGAELSNRIQSPTTGRAEAEIKGNAVLKQWARIVPGLTPVTGAVLLENQKST